LPITHETAEEVIALKPDLVLASRHSALATRNALRRLGIEVALFDVPETIPASIAQVRQMAGAVGHPERGDALIAQIGAALAAARAPEGAAPIPALILQPNGFTVGKGTLSDEVMRHTGFVNVAARYGIGAAGNVPLERLIADPPRVLLAGVPWPGAPGWAERILRHPALSALSGQIRRAELPERLMYCGGPVLIGMAETLAAAREERP
jgi:iron complex transport system substrate-binding protein